MKSKPADSDTIHHLIVDTICSFWTLRWIRAFKSYTRACDIAHHFITYDEFKRDVIKNNRVYRVPNYRLLITIYITAAVSIAVLISIFTK